MLQKALDPVVELQKKNNDKLSAMQGQLLVLQRKVNPTNDDGTAWLGNRELFLLALVIVVQSILFWMFKWKVMAEVIEYI